MNDHSSSLTVEDLLAPAVCVPPPIHPHMPLYLRCRAQLHEWEALKDTYAASVIRNGLQLDWADVLIRIGQPTTSVLVLPTQR